MKVNVGHRNYGYHSLNEVPQMTGNELASYNKTFNYLKLGVAVVEAGVLIGFSNYAYATGIDLTPVDRIVNEGYWTLFKVGGMLATPFIAWAGLSLLPGSSAGRTKAKVIGFSVGGGILVVCGAPWAGHQLIALASRVFA